MIKLGLCITIVASCCLLGYLKAASFRGRCIELQNINELIKLMDLDITYKKDTLSKSFERVSEIRQCWFSNVLKSCNTKLKCHYSLSDSWENSVVQYRAKCPLKDKDIEILNDFILGLGRTDTEGQKKIFDPTYIRLEANLDDARLQEQKLGKMYISLGTAAGVIGVILLI